MLILRGTAPGNSNISVSQCHTGDDLFNKRSEYNESFFGIAEPFKFPWGFPRTQVQGGLIYRVSYIGVTFIQFKGRIKPLFGSKGAVGLVLGAGLPINGSKW